MKLRFQTVWRATLAILVVNLVGAIWAGAQTNANRTAITSTNASPLVREVERFERAPLTFKLDEVPVLREHTILGEPLWKYIASLIYLLLAFYVSKLIDLITGVCLKNLIVRREWKLEFVLELFHGPVKIVVLVVLLHIGLNLFDWSPLAQLYLSKGLILVVAASLTYVAVRVLDLFLESWKRRHSQEANLKFNDQLFWVIRLCLNTFIIVVAILVTAQNLNVNITAAIASLSIGGLAVGLAAQDTLANLFGAIAVFVDKPFRVGDQIKLDGAEGTVEIVGLRSTRLRNPDGQMVAVPNKTMGNATITNITQRSTIKTVMNLPLARTLPAAKVKRALEILREIYCGHPKTQEAWISFNQFAGGNLNIQIVHWWHGTDYQQYLAGMQEMNLAVKDRFDEEGISFA